MVLFLRSAKSLPETIYIGALLEGEEEDKEQELALRYAVDRINNNNAILPSTRVQLLTRRLPAGDNFHVSKAVCDFMLKGARIILSVQSLSTAAVARSACARFHLPFLHVRASDFGTSDGSPFALGFYPDPAVLSRATLDLLLALDWRSFTIVYRSESSFLRLRDVLKYAFRPPGKVRLVHCCGGKQTFASILSDLRVKRELRILLHLPTSELDTFMAAVSFSLHFLVIRDDRRQQK